MESSGRREYPLYTVDAFTDVPFSGNPAAVCLVTEDRVGNLLEILFIIVIDIIHL